ncbi:hypothetical protein F5146DRAFT_1053959 [Armillaria mellea]|nr:hypothetical protein F5146DRAFT_1053959 [Armillaria mellea]
MADSLIDPCDRDALRAYYKERMKRRSYDLDFACAIRPFRHEKARVWLSERPEHAKHKDLRNKYAEYVEGTKRIVSLLCFKRAGGTTLISNLVKKGIGWPLTVCRIQGDVKVIRRRYRNDLQVICPLRDCYEQYLEVMANWAKEKLENPEET